GGEGRGQRRHGSRCRGDGERRQVGRSEGGCTTPGGPCSRLLVQPCHDFRVVGKALRKVDATAKVLGVTKFADDLSLPRMLYCKLLRSPHPHARIVRIDAARALALPGVKAVLTGKDLPIPFGILPVSQDEHALALD